MKKYIVTALAAASLLLSGCGKDFLTEDPKLSQSNVLTLSTLDGIDASIAGAYGPLASNNWYGANFILANEMKTMNGKRWIQYADYNSGRYTDEYAVNFTPNSTSPLWGTAYYVILAANSVIEALDNVEGDEAAKNNIKAEALFLRALSHFDLVRTYAQPYNYTSGANHLGVPVVTKVDTEAKPERNTVAEVYEQIITDLLEAESIIGDSYARSAKDGRAVVRKEVIQALLARVYQYTAQWQKAADYATKVIDSGKYKLWTAKEVVDAYGVDVPTGGEVIFEVYGHTANSYGTGLTNVWGMTSYEQYGDCGASGDLLAIYEDGDVRAELLSPDTKDRGLFTLKYFGKGLGAIDMSNVIILRLSEMYLIRAEAVVNGASGSNAAADLKLIADNRGATAQSATLDGVYAELAKEFAWEGHLWFDLARTKRAMTRTDVSGTTIPTNIPAGDYRWAMPISQGERDANPNLEQNDGYGN